MSLYSQLLLLRWFLKGMVTSLYSSTPIFQIDNIVKNKKKSLWKVKIWNKDLCSKEKEKKCLMSKNIFNEAFK